VFAHDGWRGASRCIRRCRRCNPAAPVNKRAKADGLVTAHRRAVPVGADRLDCQPILFADPVAVSSGPATQALEGAPGRRQSMRPSRRWKHWARAPADIRAVYRAKTIKASALTRSGQEFRTRFMGWTQSAERSLSRGRGIALISLGRLRPYRFGAVRAWGRPMDAALHLMLILRDSFPSSQVHSKGSGLWPLNRSDFAVIGRKCGGRRSRSPP